jgi:cysteine desulfurase / selenocysteine lyase
MKGVKTEVFKQNKREQFKFDVNRYRKDFPILAEQIYGKPLVYFDNAATTQKPQVVIDAISNFYEKSNANIHRGVFLLSQKATEAYENVRKKVCHFIHAPAPEQVIFVRGTTEAINLVAQTFGRMSVREGDEIIISTMEHHSNIVPWQMIVEQIGAKLQIAPINDDGDILVEEYKKLFNSKTKLVALCHVSNALGTVNPVKELVSIAHASKVPVLIDGAQAVPHLQVDVQDLDCDFYAFSGHKMYGPTGIGVLYGKWDLLESMPPFQGGGDMIRSVTFKKTTYSNPPFKFEPGTPDIAEVIGLGAAIDYLTSIGLEQVGSYEQELLGYATEILKQIPELHIIGEACEKASVISFILDEIHPHDIGTVLDHEGVAIRAGHHCAMPLMERFSVPATARASFSFYNTKKEVDVLKQALLEGVRILK